MTLRYVNDSIPARLLKKGDLWLRELPEADHAVVQITDVSEPLTNPKTGTTKISVQYDVLFNWLNDANYEEALNANEDVHVVTIVGAE